MEPKLCNRRIALWRFLSIALPLLLLAGCGGSSPTSGTSKSSGGHDTLTVQISSAGGQVDGHVTVAGTACTARICHFAEQSGGTVSLSESTMSSKHPFVKWQVDGSTQTGQSINVTMTRKNVYINAVFHE